MDGLSHCVVDGCHAGWHRIGSLVFRRLTAIVLSIALQGGALTASLVHSHLDGHDHQHHRGARVVHAHLGGHHGSDHRHGQPAGTPVVGSDDETGGIGYLHAFLAVHPANVIEQGLPTDGFVIPATYESVMRRAPVVVLSHGPPVRGPAESRAPPAFLS